MTANKNNTNMNQKYEALYTELLDRGDQLHESNKRRIRRGIILLIILPVILDSIRLLTDSDKVVFLIIWIIIMFVLSAYLISVEYLDSAIEKTLRDVTETEADFDGLLPRPELPVADLHERIRDRLGERRTVKLSEAESEAEEEAEYIEEVIEHLEETMGEVETIAADAIALTRMDETYTSDSEPEETVAAGLKETEDAENAVEELKEESDLIEAEEAMEELRETAPAEIITAMKEAFDRDMSRKEDAE